NTNAPDVTISFNSKGSDLFCAFTRDRVTHPQNDPQNKLAIFIDKDLVEDANVISEICGGTAQITGGFTAASAQALAIQLNSGALPGTVSLASPTDVGRTLGAAMEAGVHRAWPAIRDSNISTLITCFVLYFFGAPLIKGFAITLAIGVTVSMFSAIVTTQQFLQIVAGLRPARRLAFYGVQAPKAA